MNDWIERAKILAVFVKEVGVPSIFFLVVMALVIGIVIGWIPNPFVSAAQFEQHRLVSEQLRKEMGEEHKASLKEHQDQTKTLKAIRCEEIREIPRRDRCYARLLGTLDVP